MIELDLLEMPMPIEDYNQRVRDTLRRVSGKRHPTYGDIVWHKPLHFMSFKNVGRTTVHEIQDILKRVGLEMAK